MTFVSTDNVNGTLSDIKYHHLNNTSETGITVTCYCYIPVLALIEYPTLFQGIQEF